MRSFARFVVAVSLTLVAAAWTGADPVFTLADPQVFKKPSRGWVKFDHGAHEALEGVSCRACHHDFVNLKGGDPSPRCAACHASPAQLQNSFHELCITCHDADARKGNVTGPRTCGECHAARLDGQR
ncbi:MAG TPA: cytochrome c3 family protein [Spirochaetia bacterium]